ncbi:retinoic acid-induced protein 2-like [Periophthalmus magnuspinnatus]|uniref:retinoic acid-induced protein 2-like n=1 Tax=Periophthalmus magnuspinnatus TaxID=409849 RepID=UPI00145ADF34|nr:retinoic acid-induced protein 2-like [Periophthalmus magnuspinnatus]
MMEAGDGATGNMAQPHIGGSSETEQEQTAAKTDSAAPEACEEVASELKTGVSHLSEAPSGGTPSAESPGEVALKVATTVLHPVCLGDSPLMLPIHLQMNGGPQMGAAPYLITSQSPMSLPLVLEQQVLQHMGPSVIPQSPNCAPLPLQSSVLCQGALPFALSPGAEQKATGQTQDSNLLSLLQNPAFAAFLQDLFPSQTGASGCQSPGSPFFSTPPLTPSYSSPLTPLVPPATLLVPYPVIIPLPVPLPVPLPIPVPIPSEDSKGNLSKSVCTVSQSTQTCLQDTTSVPVSLGHCPSVLPSHTVSVPSPPEEAQVLDLSVKTCPIQPKQEFPSAVQQDSVLDLSVPGGRGKAPEKCSSMAVGCSQSLDSKLLSSLASVEFSRQHKWVVDSTPGCSSLGQDPSLSGTGNLEIVSASQTAKVIVSVKDAIPAILCGKIKGLSGVSTKNFSIKRDAAQGTSLQQFYEVQPVPQGEQRDSNNPLKKVSKNRAIKLKKVSSQEIHFLPIKKQRLAALLPRK